jgi:predicted dehydrogenase
MRVAITGASHWHLRLYLDNLLQMRDVAIVGISDPDADVAATAAAAAKCRSWIDYREMCAAAEPDFVFALGYHTEMAAVAHHLIDRRIPFAMEKPCGVDADEVGAVARHAREQNAFASVCFVMRCSPMLDVVKEFAQGERMHYLGFKFVGGLASRYHKMNSEWVLDPKVSHGGALLNLGVHCLDLACLMLPEPPHVAGASLSNALAGYGVEDHALVLLKAGAATAYVETGYLYPPGRGTYDQHFAFRTTRHYFLAENARTLEIGDEAGNWTAREVPTTNSACYPLFVRETLRRVERHEPPVADMDDMLRVMELVQAAYAMAPLDAQRRGNGSESE